MTFNTLYCIIQLRKEETLYNFIKKGGNIMGTLGTTLVLIGGLLTGLDDLLNKK